jgi:hypothetical protein
MVDDSFSGRLLNFREEGRGQRAFKAAAINTQYTFHLSVRSYSYIASGPSPGTA